MKGAAAKKNKQKGSLHSTSSSGAFSNDRIVKDEKDIEQQLEKARSGNHDELQRRKSVIERDIEKKIVAADRFRKLQLKNINDLYDFEIISLQSQCQKAIQEMEEKFIDDLKSQLEVAQKIGSRNKAKKEYTEAVDVTDAKPERSLRSVAAGAGKESSGLDWANLLKENYKESRPAPKRRVVNAPNPLSMLEKTIEEKDARSDLLHIVKDLEQRATSFNKRQKSSNVVASTAAVAATGTSSGNAEESKPIFQPVVKIDSLGRLSVDDKRYVVGDAVQVYSLLSDESFLGFITVIDTEEIILRSVTGPRFSFPLGLLKTGRVTLQLDTTIKEELTTYNLNN